jgi:small subunit ribosomal protein S5
MVDKLVHINRVAKVVKGGKRFGFAALVVVGDQKGRVGFGMARRAKCRKPSARPPRPPSATQISCRCAKAARCITTSKAAGAQARSAAPPRPVPASSPAAPMRAVFETLGMHDVVAKSMGSSNPPNMVAPRSTR